MTFNHRALEGIVSATPTPLRADGTLDQAMVAMLAEHVVQGGATAIAPNGGTGEYTALTPAQRREMLEATVASVAGRIPVIAGVLSPGIGEALEATRDAVSAGADMIMLVTPYYARPTPQGVVDYYKAVADVTDLPLMLYEIPYRTGIQLDADTVMRLVEEAGVVAMKTCSHDLAYQMRVMAAIGDRATILTGEENVFPAHVAIGAKGGFLASSLLFPKAWQYLYRLCASGQMAEAATFHRRLMPYVTMLYREHNPTALRAALALCDMPHGDCLPPLRPASAETIAMLTTELPAALRLEAEAAQLLEATAINET
ncbi:dihydrodipicolinate synthase family protein [Szabonella alba]|uniref:Dihydrodipicolinate synthase family protein n=1 Tax=Szabonella alba TaxID=2804194 RepID=A0A8K0Y1U4_9RHOB|nr:dihydrodipicolinate synthase family protein [Szabonella alba]MBL4919276.1 dihydrodipicolinate synthase family protein [Szabonella alba]